MLMHPRRPWISVHTSVKCFLLLLLLAPLTLAEDTVFFSRDIAPVLREKCLACHKAEKAKGDYRVDTFTELLQAVTPGKPEESELFKRLTTEDEDDRMPQESEPLPSHEVTLFKQWITAGAKLDLGTPDTEITALTAPVVNASAPEKYPRATPILALAFHPAGELLAASGYNEINLWTTNGELRTRIANVPPRTRSLAFHPGGKHLALAGGKAGRSGELSIYNAADGVTNLLRTADEMLAVVFSPDGKLLAGAGSDNAIYIFDFETLEKLETVQQHADWVTALSFSADGARLASASRDRTARIYTVADSHLETTYPSHKTPLYAVGFISEQMAASAGRDRSVHLWKIEDGKKNGELTGFGGEIYQILAAGGNIFTACADKQVRQHSSANRKLVRTYSGHGSPVFALAIHEPAGVLASGGHDGEVRIWNTADGALVRRFVAAPGLNIAAQ